jgi:hypothetical protein
MNQDEPGEVHTVRPLALFAWDTIGSGLNARKQRKVYFIAPLLGGVAQQTMPRSRRPEPDAVRENLMGNGLYRSATDRLLQAGGQRPDLPGGAWRTARAQAEFHLTPELRRLQQGKAVP